MPAYNLTNLSKVGDIGDLLVYANDAVKAGNANIQLFGIMLLAFFFIMLMVLKRWDFDRALLSSSFACFILSLILAYGHLVTFIYPILFMVTLAFTGFYMYMRGGQ